MPGEQLAERCQHSPHHSPRNLDWYGLKAKPDPGLDLINLADACTIRTRTTGAQRLRPWTCALFELEPEGHSDSKKIFASDFWR